MWESLILFWVMFRHNAPTITWWPQLDPNNNLEISKKKVIIEGLLSSVVTVHLLIHLADQPIEWQLKSCRLWSRALVYVHTKHQNGEKTSLWIYPLRKCCKMRKVAKWDKYKASSGQQFFGPCRWQSQIGIGRLVWADRRDTVTVTTNNSHSKE